MKSYSCKPCDFLGIYKSDYERHLRTQKHKEKCPEKISSQTTETPVISVSKKYECVDCHMVFGTKDLLIKHSNDCIIAMRMKIMSLEKEMVLKDTVILAKEKDNEMLKKELALRNQFHEEIITEKEKELALRSQFHEEMITEKDRVVDFFEEENEYHKSSLDKQVNTVNKITTSAIKYLQQHCPNAPRLEAPKDYDAIWEELEEKKLLLKNVCTWASNGNLALRMSEKLIVIYKKKDKTEQSLWGVDSSRTNYAEMEDDWIVDKKGSKIKDKIIIPFIDDLWERVSDEYSNGGDKYPLVDIYFPAVKKALDGSGREETIKKILKEMCGELHLNKEGKTKNGKFLTYVEREEEAVDSDDPIRTKEKKKSPKKKAIKKEPEPYHSTDSSDHPSDSDQCDKKYEERCKRDEKEKAKKEQKEQKEIVIIDAKKKKGKRV